MFICFYQALKEKQVAKNHKYYFCHIAWTLSSTNHLCLKIMTVIIIIIIKNVALHVESFADRKISFYTELDLPSVFIKFLRRVRYRQNLTERKIENQSKQRQTSQYQVVSALCQRPVTFSKNIHKIRKKT